MAIPSYQEILLPLLDFTKDGKDHSMQEAEEYIAGYFKLSEAERKELIPSGRSFLISNRVGWSRTYLKKAGLIDLPKRSYIKITSRGLSVLQENPSYIDVEYLRKFPEFLEFIGANPVNNIISAPHEKTNLQTPEEILDASYQHLRKNLAQEILEKIKKLSPHFFEQLVVDLLLAMGYGGSRVDAGRAIGKSGDGGIDGIIDEDKLGLDVIYLQAKRWESVVGSKEIRNFVGSLVGKKANKGVFITTSRYTKDAIDYTAGVHHKVILIDGEKLVELMIDHNVGVAKDRSYEIKKIDYDYFEE